MRKSRTPGSVRGVSGNGYPYRDIFNSVTIIQIACLKNILRNKGVQNAYINHFDIFVLLILRNVTLFFSSCSYNWYQIECN